jgi:hypothetical protein
MGRGLRGPLRSKIAGRDVIPNRRKAAVRNLLFSRERYPASRSHSFFFVTVARSSPRASRAEISSPIRA